MRIKKFNDLKSFVNNLNDEQLQQNMNQKLKKNGVLIISKSDIISMPTLVVENNIKSFNELTSSLKTFSCTMQATINSPDILNFFHGNGFDKRHPLKGRELARFLKSIFNKKI